MPRPRLGAEHNKYQAIRFRFRPISKIGIRHITRLWFDLYWCYKLVFGLVDVHNDHCNLFVLKSDCVTRGHPYKLSRRHCTSNVRSSFFSERVINAWNNLPMQWRRKQFASGGHNAGAKRRPKFFDMPPHFSIVPPHEVAQLLFATD